MSEDAKLYLERILFGERLEDKLGLAPIPYQNLDWSKTAPLRDIVEKPGRSGLLVPRSHGNQAFPKRDELKLESGRGRLLHYFANHELLAIEGMAYVLLKFPEAPEDFKRGVYRTLQDEQRHLNIYLERMHQCGVEMGTVPLNLYFWNALKNIKSPLEYVALMSLTFEQANLDFALAYAKLFKEEIDDESTAKLLTEIHDDEVKHVNHGYEWFKKLRNQNESEFECYRSLLPFPMTPRRARGGETFSAESRREAKMSEDFIESIRVAGGSRGKVPNFYFFNPECEFEQDAPLSEKALQKIEDLRPLLFWLAGEEDVVELTQVPDLKWLGQFHDLHGETAEWITNKDQFSRYAFFDEVRPWGFSKKAWEKIEAISLPIRSLPRFDRKIHSENLFSKAYWKKVLHDSSTHIVSTESELESALAQVFSEQTNDLLIKNARGTSGRGHMLVPHVALLDPHLFSKLLKRLKTTGTLLLEPFFSKVQDFSVQYEIQKDGHVIAFESRRFEVDTRFQYRGAHLGGGYIKGDSDQAQASRFLLSQKEEIKKAHAPILEHLKSLSYVGPFGVDGLIAKKHDGGFELVPVIEVNVRYTLGRIAIRVEKDLMKRGYRAGIFTLINDFDLAKFHARDFGELVRILEESFGPRFIQCNPFHKTTKTLAISIGSEHPDETLIDRFLRMC